MQYPDIYQGQGHHEGGPWPWLRLGPGPFSRSQKVGKKAIPWWKQWHLWNAENDKAKINANYRFNRDKVAVNGHIFCQNQTGADAGDLNEPERMIYGWEGLWMPVWAEYFCN